MSRVIHFEIHAEDPQRAVEFYRSAITLGTDDYAATATKILAAGGSEALPKYALPGMAWQGYFPDPESNVFGLHQPDENAK